MKIGALLAKPHSGLVVGIAIASVAGLLLTAGLVFDLGWVRTWKLIGFPGALPPFYDLRAVTEVSAECAVPGNAYPYLSAPCNPWGRFNYPPVWLLLGKLGVEGSHTALLALLFELPALGLFAFILRGRSVRAGMLSLLMVFSPSTVLAFERGNTDIAVWVLICAAALIFRERRPLHALAAFALLAGGIVLKFLSAFCCTIFIRLKPTSIIIAGLIVAFTLGYVYSISDVMPVIRHTTPVSPFISYGYPVIFDRLEHLYAPRLGINLAGLTKSPIPIVVVSVAILAAIAAALRLWRMETRMGQIATSSTGVLFLFGSGVFCGTFLLGTNYTYRLMFLLLCLPQILDWMEPKNSNSRSRALGYLIFGSCVVSMWLKFYPERTFHINQLTDWILFATFSMLLALNTLTTLWKAPQESPLKRFFGSDTASA